MAKTVAQMRDEVLQLSARNEWLNVDELAVSKMKGPELKKYFGDLIEKVKDAEALKAQEELGSANSEDLQETKGGSVDTKEKPAAPLPDLAQTDETQLVKCAIDNDFFAGSLWAMTGKVMGTNRSLFDLTEPNAKKVMAANFASLLDANVDPTLIPEKGMDRKGDVITLRKKSGQVKWSSWSVTARMVQNTSTIFKGIEILGFQTVFPNGVLIPRSQLDKLLDEQEDEAPKEKPVQTVKRCLEMANKKLAEINDLAELVECNEFLETFIETYREQIQVLKSGAVKVGETQEA